MERELVERAKEGFLRKLIVHGFAVEPSKEGLVLYPRLRPTGIVEVIWNGEKWIVNKAVGAYAPYARGAKRAYFESYINKWMEEALEEARG